jgi:glucokinase
VANVPADCVIGVDLGGTKLFAGAVDPELGVHHRVHRLVPTDDLPRLLDTIVDAVGEASTMISGDVRAVGFGIPCLIDRERGVAVSSVHLPIEGVAFADVMAERLALPAFVDNDANLALLAEHRYGAARGARNALMLTLGTGIGGGLVIDGELYRGSTGAGGELGHMVVWADGPECGPGCPGRGCLESVASGTALVADAQRAALEQPGSDLGQALAAGREITGPLVTELAHDGDAAARAVLERIGRWLGVGITSLINIFDPDVVVVGGGVIAAGELLLAPARAAVAERALGQPGAHARIVAAHFGAESGMLGAAVLARDSIKPPT